MHVSFGKGGFKTELFEEKKMMLHYYMMVMFVGSFTQSVPPAARSLAVLVAVYAIITAAKLSPWLSQYITGWGAVAVNVILTILGLIVAIPADQLYSWNSFVSVVVSVLGSSGIHGMTKNIPSTPPVTPAATPYIPSNK
jgi:hypothetical protein